jgi:hypothetical protein
MREYPYIHSLRRADETVQSAAGKESAPPAGYAVTDEDLGDAFRPSELDYSGDRILALQGEGFGSQTARQAYVVLDRSFLLAAQVILAHGEG